MIYSLDHLSNMHTVLLTVVTMLFIISPWLTYFVTKFTPFDTLPLFTYFTYHPPPASGNHWSVLCICEHRFFFIVVVFVFLFFKIPNISEIICHCLSLTYFTKCNALKVNLVVNGKIFLFLITEYYFILCIYCIYYILYT